MPIPLSPSAPRTAAPPRARTAVVTFVLLSYSLAWLAVAPLWIGGQGLDHPQSKLLIGLMMFAPAVATFIVLRFVSRPHSILHATGMTPLRPAGTLLRYCAAGLVLPPLILGAGLLVAVAAGAYEVDLADFSAFRELAAPMGLVDANGSGIPITALALFAVVQTGGLVLGLPMMFGEEWGWRGYLLPALLRLGTWPAMLVHGVIWGVWHAPIILLGYNFGRPDLLGLGAMTVWCVLLGVVLGWLRLASGSIWPAVVAHGANNSAWVTFVVFGDADTGIGDMLETPHVLWVTSGIVLLAVIVAGYLAPGIRNSVPARPKADGRGDAE